jgi:phosphoribosylaminoimidazole carboxylase/phosphoribosylaminoimidazole-succinocarboxamide synthase
MASSTHDILGQKLFDGKTKTIYSMIDQPGLICIYRKDYYQSSDRAFYIPGSRRSSIDSSMRFNQQQQQQQNLHNNSNSYIEIPGKGTLTTSITACVYEILREASIPTFYVAPHPQPDIFIARKCTMIPILWIIRRIANETYVKRNPGIINGHRFVPPIVEIYHKRHPLVYRRLTIGNIDENIASSRESLLDDDDSDSDECLSSIWSYEQLLNAHFEIENLKITQTEIEYMYEICCAIFDILEHIWMVKKNCQLIDLKIEFGITTTTTKEIVVANTFDIETWHILRLMQKTTPPGNDAIQENLIWINNALRDILDLNINIPLTAKIAPRRRSLIQQKQQSTFDDVETDEDDKAMNRIIPENDHIDIQSDVLSLNIYSSSFSPSTSNRCVVICSSFRDVEHGQKIKVTLNETYNIQCDIRLCSIYKSTQTILKFLSNYSYEHCRPTIFVTLGNINNGLAMCLSSNSQYPVIHCSLMSIEQQNNLFDINSYLSHDTSMFTVVFTLSSAIQNVVQILAMNDWRLWTKQRGKRLKNYLDLLINDQQLTNTMITQQTTKTNNGILTLK